MSTPLSLMSSADNYQILAFLSFLPIGYECVKLAYRRRHELSMYKLVLAIFPMKSARYRTLQREEVFPEPFWRDGPHIGLIAGVSGLSWARPTVGHRIPIPSVGRRGILLHPIPPAPQRILVEDIVGVKNEDEEYTGSVEMKTLLLSPSFVRKYLILSPQGETQLLFIQ